MADFGGIGIALSGLKTMLDLSKSVHDANIARKISEEVANIQGQLIDVQQQALAIQQENQQLRSELERFKSFTYHHSVNWKRLPDGSEDGPFCPVCIAVNREMRLALVPRANQSRDFWMLYCPQTHHPVEGIQTAPGPFFDVPKDLLPENYFSYIPV
jgi:hypothetical protein